MEIIKLLGIIATLATMAILVTGVRVMATGREIAHHDSADWMAFRVAAQAIAFGIVLLSFYS